MEMGSITLIADEKEGRLTWERAETKGQDASHPQKRAEVGFAGIFRLLVILKHLLLCCHLLIS